MFVQKSSPLQEPHVKLGGCKGGNIHMTLTPGRTSSELWGALSSRGTISPAIEAVGVSGMVVTFWVLKRLDDEWLSPGDGDGNGCDMLVQLPSLWGRQPWQVLPFFMQKQFLQWPEWLHPQQDMSDVACFLVLWWKDLARRLLTQSLARFRSKIDQY